MSVRHPERRSPTVPTQTHSGSTHPGFRPRSDKIGENRPTAAKPVNFANSVFVRSTNRRLIHWSRRLWRVRLWAIVAIAALTLSGCVRYDVGVRFDHQTHGEIVQQVDLSKRFANLSSATVREWTDSLNRRARSLQGYTQKQGDRRLRVVIPFNNGDELAQKFEQFFNPEGNPAIAPEKADRVPNLETHLALEQRNFVFALSNHLSLDIDLRALGVLSTEGNVLVSSGGLVDLSFRLDTPWGASVAAVDGAEPPVREGNALVWHLQPGEIQHLEADFWIPSPIGIGGAIIAVVVAIASYLKHQLLPALGIGKKPTPQPSES